MSTKTVMLPMPFTVEYELCGGTRGYRDSLGRPEEPDDPMQVIIEDIKPGFDPLRIRFDAELKSDIRDILEDELL